MKNINLIFSILLPIAAYSQPVSDLNLKIDALEKQKIIKIKKIADDEQDMTSFSKERQETLDRVLIKRENLKTLQPRKKKKYQEISSEIDKELEATKIPLEEQIRFTHYRNQNRYRSYLKCLKRSMNSEIWRFNSKIESCRPKRANGYSQSKSFMNKLTDAQTIFSIDKKKLQAEYNKDLERVSALGNKIVDLQKTLRTDKKEMLVFDEDLDTLKVQFKQQKYLVINKNFYSCNDQTPTLDLENKTIHSQTKDKGPFLDIPRDHQDGVGTCFANTAKNLLVGLSDGKLNASFLDMALQYKSDNSNGTSFDLDGGHSCQVLDIIKQVGYCPKDFSPIESGDESQKIGGLFNSSNNLYRQAEVIEMLKRFMDGKKVLEENSDSCSTDFIKNSKMMVEALRSNPDIKLPYPVMNDFFLDKNTMLGYYHWSYKNKVSNPISEEDYLNDYEKVKVEFSKSYLQAAVEKDSPLKLKSRFENTYGAFFSKYGFEDQLKGPINSPRLKSFLEESYDETFIKEALSTNEFYKKFLSKNNDTVNLLDSSCLKDNSILTNFLSGLSEIANLFRFTGGDTNVLFDKDGKFISNYDLMTLAVAPKCLNSENRIKPDFDYSCKVITTDRSVPLENEIQNKRKLIITSLLDGLPVGNSHPQPGGFHINTIVGYRFNESKNQCEYKIRESQTATSFWSSETSIMTINRDLTFTEKQ
jgi:hypothetical protein